MVHDNPPPGNGPREYATPQVDENGGDYLTLGQVRGLLPGLSPWAIAEQCPHALELTGLGGEPVYAAEDLRPLLEGRP